MDIHSDTFPANKKLNRIGTIYYHMKLEAYPKIKKNRNVDFYTSFLVIGYDSDTILNQTFSCADSFTVVVPIPPDIKYVRIFASTTAVTFRYRPLNIFRRKKTDITHYKMNELVIKPEYIRDCIASYGVIRCGGGVNSSWNIDGNTNINDFVRKHIPGIN